MRHPLSGSTYGVDPDGLVRVEKNGSFGRFLSNGRWVEGTIRAADPQLCLWIGGPQLPEGADSFMAMLGGNTADSAPAATTASNGSRREPAPAEA
jgi:hypothetical protein